MSSLSGVDLVPRLASRRAPVLLRLRRDERSEALVVLRARRAPFQVRTHPGDRGVGLALAKFELDVAIEELEALLAAHLGPRRGPSRRPGSESPGREHRVSSRHLRRIEFRLESDSPCSASTGAQLSAGVVNRSCRARRAWWSSARRARRSERRRARRRRARRADGPKVRLDRAAMAARISRPSAACSRRRVAAVGEDRPRLGLERNLAALPGAAPHLHGRLEQRELVRPGGEVGCRPGSRRAWRASRGAHRPRSDGRGPRDRRPVGAASVPPAADLKRAARSSRS